MGPPLEEKEIYKTTNGRTHLGISGDFDAISRDGAGHANGLERTVGRDRHRHTNLRPGTNLMRNREKVGGRRLKVFIEFAALNVNGE